MCQSTEIMGPLLYAQRLVISGIDTKDITGSLYSSILYFSWMDKTCMNQMLNCY